MTLLALENNFGGPLTEDHIQRSRAGIKERLFPVQQRMYAEKKYYLQRICDRKFVSTQIDATDKRALF
jgi:hypothetical protein